MRNNIIVAAVYIAAMSIAQLASAADDSVFTLECTYSQEDDIGKKKSGVLYLTFALPLNQVFNWDYMEWSRLSHFNESTLVVEAQRDPKTSEVREISINRYSGHLSWYTAVPNASVSRTGECKKVELKRPPAQKF